MIILALTAALLSADHHGENIHAEGMPWCDSLEADRPHTDCALQTGEGRDFLVNVEYSDMEDGREMVDVSVTQFDGTLVQTLHFASESFFYPSLIDLDGDGFEEFLVPIETGNVNTIYSISIGSEYGFDLTADEISGFGIDPVTDGLFVARSRGSAVDHYASFYTIEEGRFVLEASVHITYDETENMVCTQATGNSARGEDFYCDAAMSQ